VTCCTICNREIKQKEIIRKWEDGSGFAHKSCIDKEKSPPKRMRPMTAAEQHDMDIVTRKQPIPLIRDEGYK
jgi:hypothetical protein